MTKLGICGVGAFGFALLKHIDQYNKCGKYEIVATEYDKNVLNELKEKRCHPFLYDSITVSEKVNFVDTYDEMAKDADVILLAVPSVVLRQTVRAIKPSMKDGVIILNVAKALEKESAKRLSEVISEEMGDKPYSYAILAGGTIGKDLFMHEPLGVDIASTESESLDLLYDLFHTDTLNVYKTTDVVGVEYASAFKNVISILAGIVKGVGFSYGSETHMISRSASEIEKFIITKFKADPKTFETGSQCWGNDLWMSCTGKTRNREFGELVGSGMSVEDAKAKMLSEKKTVEGLATISIVKQVIGGDDSFVIFPALVDIIENGADPKLTILELMNKNI